MTCANDIVCFQEAQATTLHFNLREEALAELWAGIETLTRVAPAIGTPADVLLGLKVRCSVGEWVIGIGEPVFCPASLDDLTDDELLDFVRHSLSLMATEARRAAAPFRSALAVA